MARVGTRTRISGCNAQDANRLYHGSTCTVAHMWVCRGRSGARKHFKKSPADRNPVFPLSGTFTGTTREFYGKERNVYRNFTSRLMSRYFPERSHKTLAGHNLLFPLSWKRDFYRNGRGLYGMFTTALHLEKVRKTPASHSLKWPLRENPGWGGVL